MYQRYLKQKTALLSGLAAFMLAGVVSASGASTMDSNPLAKYNGMYSPVECKVVSEMWSNGNYGSERFDVEWAVSDVPGQLDFSISETYYSDASCSTAVGSRWVYYVMSYKGVAKNVPFFGVSKLPIDADKFIAKLVKKGNAGIAGDFDYPEIGKEFKILMAMEPGFIYFDEKHSARDSEGFPTLLNGEGLNIIPGLRPIN